MEIKKSFKPGLNPKTDLESGMMSSLSWHNLKKYLDIAFRLNENEEIVGITITEDGIKAKIEIKKAL